MHSRYLVIRTCLSAAAQYGGVNVLELATSSSTLSGTVRGVLFVSFRVAGALKKGSVKKREARELPDLKLFLDGTKFGLPSLKKEKCQNEIGGIPV